MSAPARPALSRVPPLPGGRAGWAALILAAAALVLAIDPAIWLANSWVDPSYDSSGLIVFAVTAVLFLWSVTSPVIAAGRASRAPLAIGLLAASAALRLAGQVLAVNVIGAVGLIVDLYAIGLLCRLDRRSRALSPAWLAAVFAFALPLERVLQRSVGYALQEVSARGACELLSTFYADLACQGVRLIVNGADVLVDLPCSGARALLLGLLGYAVVASVCRPTPGRAVVGAGATLAAAGLANVVRISVLAVGLAEPARLGGVNVMERPWHDLIGLAALSIVCLAIVAWAGWCRPAAAAACARPHRSADQARRTASDAPRRPIGLWASLAALAAAVAIVNLPRTPVDVSRMPEPVRLPLAIDGQPGRAVALSAREEAYFARYGGRAAKAEYGPMGLLITRTTSPLRHLHAPEDCLRGLGFEVAYLGAAFEPIPTAVYRAVAPDGRRYRVEVSFVPDEGEATYNVAAAVWQWLKGEARSWTAVQRIAPEGLAPAEQARFTQAVVAALDIARPAPVATPKG